MTYNIIISKVTNTWSAATWKAKVFLQRFQLEAKIAVTQAVARKQCYDKFGCCCILDVKVELIGTPERVKQF